MVEKLFKIVGKTNTASYFQIAYAIQCDISKRLNLKKIHFHSNPKLLNLSIGICFGLNETKLPILKLEIQATKFIRLYDFDECLQLLEDKNFNHLSNEKKDIKKTFNNLEQLKHAGNILLELKCFDDASDYYQKSIQILTAEINISLDMLLHVSSSGIKALCKNKSDQAESLSVYLSKIGWCLIETTKANEAIQYLEQSEAIQTNISINFANNENLPNVLHLSRLSNIELHKITTAQKYFEKAIQIKERVTTNAETDTSLAKILYSLGRCLLDMNQHTDALEYFRRALQIEERTTTNAETDKNLAKTLHELG